MEDDVLVEGQHVGDPPKGPALARRDVVQIAHALAEGYRVRVRVRVGAGIRVRAKAIGLGCLAESEFRS